MPRYRTHDFPVDQVRRFLEPGPVVLVSSRHRGERGLMTLGWQMMLDFSRVATYVWDANRSFELLRRSRECVINLPTAELLDTVVRIGNCSGREGDKFERFGLTAVDGDEVGAPRVGECWAAFECRLADASWVRKRGLFVWDVVKAHVARRPKNPTTLHYRGHGEFMLAGNTVSRRRLFRPELLLPE